MLSPLGPLRLDGNQVCLYLHLKGCRASTRTGSGGQSRRSSDGKRMTLVRLVIFLQHDNFKGLASLVPEVARKDWKWLCGGDDGKLGT